MTIRPVGAEFFDTDGRTQTDMTKLIVAFRNFANSPKNLLCKRQFPSFCAPIECGIFIVTDCTAGGRHCLKQPVVVKQLRNVCSSAGITASIFAD